MFAPVCVLGSCCLQRRGGGDVCPFASLHPLPITARCPWLTLRFAKGCLLQKKDKEEDVEEVEEEEEGRRKGSDCTTKTHAKQGKQTKKKIQKSGGARDVWSANCDAPFTPFHTCNGETERPSRTTRTTRTTRTKPRVADIIATNQCCHPTKVALRYPVGSGERVGLCVELIGIGLTCQTTRAKKQRKQSVAVCRLVAVWLGCAIRAQIELMLHFRIPPYKTSLARNTQRLCRHP